MWIKRLERNRIIDSNKAFPALYLSGARQVGKTSLLRHLFPNYDYVTLDRPSLAAQAEESPDAFLSHYSTHLIIDEVQYAPSLFRHLKLVIDQNNRNTNYILTGSQHFKLVKGIQESLAGRCAILSMSPLTHYELSGSKLTQNHNIIDLMLKGGYPEIWANSVDQHIWFNSYIATYLERDVRNILSIQSLRDFDRFLRSSAFRVGNILSYSDIARDVGIAVSTAKEWNSILGTSHQTHVIEPYFKSENKRLVKSPKLFFSDTGLMCHLNGLTSPDQLKQSRLLGHIFENYVFTELNSYLESSKQHKLWFWRTQQGDEVDFLVDQGGTYHLFEVKFSESIRSDDLKGIRSFSNEYGEKSIASSTIICNTPHTHTLDGTSIISDHDIHSHLETLKLI